MDAATALKQFDAENNIMEVDPKQDEIYRYDDSEQKRIMEDKPWLRNPKCFTKVKISAVALVKMVMHARSGGNIEVMGLMQGKIRGDTMFVMDAFALPVEGTETRVNAQAEGYEYMVEYMVKSKEVGRLENAIGWYHSHPGYGCWLSGIDVTTQMLNQLYQEPWVAIVIDPKRTMSAGRVDIGAFRTYPKDYKPPDEGPDEYQSIPLNKIEDFGVHFNQYYPLEVSYFRSALDSLLLEQLWNKYWAHTLSQSPLIANHDYATRMIADLAEKLKRAEPQLARRGQPELGGISIFGERGSMSRASSSSMTGTGDDKTKTDGPLTKAVRDSSRTSIEASHGILAETLKCKLFNRQASFS